MSYIFAPNNNEGVKKLADTYVPFLYKSGTMPIFNNKFEIVDYFYGHCESLDISYGINYISVDVKLV